MSSVADFPDVPSVQQSIPTVPIVSVPTETSSSDSKGKNDIVISDIVDGYFNVFGNTKPFSSNFRDLGGSFIRESKAWKYKAENHADVTNLVNKIKEGVVKPQKFLANKQRAKYPREEDSGNQETSGLSLPSSGGSASNSHSRLNLPSSLHNGGNDQFQTIVWEGVYKPKQGMAVSIKAGHQSGMYKVTKVYTDQNGTVYTVEITGHGSGVDKVVPVNGKWKVWGFNVDHTVKFLE